MAPHREPSVNNAAARRNMRMNKSPRGQRHPTRTAARRETTPSSPGRRPDGTTSCSTAKTSDRRRRPVHVSSAAARGGGPNPASKDPRRIFSSAVPPAPVAVSPPASVLLGAPLPPPRPLPPSLASDGSSGSSSRGGLMAARPLPGTTQARKVAFVAWEIIAGVASSPPRDRALCLAGGMIGEPPTPPLKNLYPSGRAPSLDLCLEAAAALWVTLSVAAEEGSLLPWQEAPPAGAPWLQTRRPPRSRRSCRCREESERAVAVGSAVLEEGRR